jgi:prepilin-type processing-associated H-X9-DG protein
MMAANGFPLIYALTTEGAMTRHQGGIICSYADGHVAKLVKREVGMEFAPYSIGMTGSFFIDAAQPDLYKDRYATTDPAVSIEKALLEVMRDGAVGNSTTLTGSLVGKAWKLPDPGAAGSAMHFLSQMSNDTPAHVWMEVASDSTTNIRFSGEATSDYQTTFASGAESGNWLYICNTEALGSSAGTVLWGDLGDDSGAAAYAEAFVGASTGLVIPVPPMRFTGGTIDMWFYRDPKAIVRTADGDPMLWDGSHKVAGIAMRGEILTNASQRISFRGYVPMAESSLSTQGPVLKWSDGTLSLKKVWSNW